jgi:YHS domain-containing protein
LAAGSRLGPAAGFVQKPKTNEVMKNMKYLVGVLLGFLLANGSLARAEDAKDTGAKLYPLDTCLVCGMKLSMMGKPYSFVYEGQTIEVCDASEKAEFDKNPAKYLKRIADAKGKPYPLETCLVCDMKLADMDKPYAFVYHGQEIKVCGKSEEADFAKDPAQYMKKLAKAEAEQKKGKK